jgi:hypothetical protein
MPIGRVLEKKNRQGPGYCAIPHAASTSRRNFSITVASATGVSSIG